MVTGHPLGPLAPVVLLRGSRPKTIGDGLGVLGVTLVVTVEGPGHAVDRAPGDAGHLLVVPEQQRQE